MLTIEEILATQKDRRARPTQEDLRKLPYKKAFIYGRVSSPGQVRDSKESVSITTFFDPPLTTYFDPPGD